MRVIDMHSPHLQVEHLLQTIWDERDSLLARVITISMYQERVGDDGTIPARLVYAYYLAEMLLDEMLTKGPIIQERMEHYLQQRGETLVGRTVSALPWHERMIYIERIWKVLHAQDDYRSEKGLEALDVVERQHGGIPLLRDFTDDMIRAAIAEVE